MPSHRYKNLIFTTHALSRMKERSISDDAIYQVIQQPDSIKGNPKGSKPAKFIRLYAGRLYHIVAQWKAQENAWLIVSVWVRGEDDRESLSTQLVLFPFRLLWWIIRTIFKSLNKSQ